MSVADDNEARLIYQYRCSSSVDPSIAVTRAMRELLGGAHIMRRLHHRE
jgi:hypothetical protein